MDAEQKTASPPAPLQQKIDKFGRLCAACLGWGAKQPRNAQEGTCTLAGFIDCHRLALQLYLMSEHVVIPGIILCDAHEGFAEHIAPMLKECGASISWIPAEAAWLIRPEIYDDGDQMKTTSNMSYARGCDGACRKSPGDSARWVCTSGDLELTLWRPRTGLKDGKIEVYLKILSSFRAALAPLGLDVHIRVG